MAIHVQCAGCGARFQAPEKLAGKRGKCPKCGQPLAIPYPKPAAAEPADEFGLAPLAEAEGHRLATPSAPLPRPKKKKQPSNTRWIVGASAGAGAAALTLLLLFLLWPSEKDKELTKEQTTPSKQPRDDGGATPDATAARPEESAAKADEQHVREHPPASIRPRTYPSFPDALTEPPAWIGSDAPFDVAKFLEAPPPDQNAAPLYLDALLEFSSEVTTCFHEVGQKPDGEILRRAEAAKARSKECSRLEEAMSKAPASVDNAAVDAWLKGYETGFEKLAVAQQRPACVFETGVSPAAWLPHIWGARQAAQVVKWRTRRDLARGDFERPIQGVETVLRLSRDLRPRADTVCQLVSVSLIDNIRCCKEIAPEILTAKGVTAEHCDRLLAVLVKHEAEARDPFLESTRLQYVMDRIVLHDLQHHTRHTGMFDPRHMKEDSPFARLRELQGFYSNRLAREKYGAAIPQKPEEALKHPLARGWSVNGKLLSDDQYAKEVDAVNRVYKSLLDLAERTDLERDRACATGTMADPLRDTTVAVYLEPYPHRPLLQASMIADATLRGAQCLVALRRRQFDHPQPPPDLAALAKSVGLAAVPTDPYTDQPLLMTTIQGQPVIYSIGPDGKDDRARPAEFDQRTSICRGDFVFRLPPPQ